jgi:anti-sigma factor RsiW
MTEERMNDDALWLDAALDGELDAARSLALERRLAGDPAFRAQWEARRALRETVRTKASYHVAPAALGARIGAALDAASGAAPSASAPVPARAGAPTPAAAARPRRGWSWQWLFASGLGGALAASFATFVMLGVHGPQPSREGELRVAMASPDEVQSGLDAEAVSAHTRALLVGETLEVVSSDRHTVRPWLASRLNFVPAVADFASEGYALAGARRDVIGGETAAALVYRHGEHVISVFVRPLRAPGAASDAAAAETEPVLRVVRGFNVVEMTHAGMAYSLVSDMNVHEMSELATLLRKQPA